MFPLLISNLESVVDSTEMVEESTEQIVYYITDSTPSSEAIADISGKLDSLISSIAPLNDSLTGLHDILVNINNLIFRLNEWGDFIIPVAVCVLLCIIYYRYLEYFTRF